MNFTKFIGKSVRVRPDFEDNLLVVHLPWKEQFDILIGEIPSFFTDIYVNCNGIDPEEESKHLHFIPEYRLLKIQELLKIHGEFVKEYDIKNASVIPFLIKNENDYICYHIDDNGTEDIVGFVDGKIIPMYDSIQSFWTTLCECYDEKVFGIDFKNTLSADPKKLEEISKKNNPNSKYWN